MSKQVSKLWTHVKGTHLLLLFPVPHAYLYLTGMPVTDWLTDWHTHTHTHTHARTHTHTHTHTWSHTCTHTHSFMGRAIVLFWSQQSHVHFYKIARKQKEKSREGQLGSFSVSQTHTHTHTNTHTHTHTHTNTQTGANTRTHWGRVQMVLTVFQCCGGYSLAWFWDPVRGSQLWCHCKHTGLDRHWRCPWAGQRASPPTSRVAARPECPCPPQNCNL